MLLRLTTEFQDGTIREGTFNSMDAEEKVKNLMDQITEKEYSTLHTFTVTQDGGSTQPWKRVYYKRG